MSTSILAQYIGVIENVNNTVLTLIIDQTAEVLGETFLCFSSQFALIDWPVVEKSIYFFEKQ